MQTKFFVYFWMLLTKVHESDLTTCEVPSVPKGELTHITCHFNEDIVQVEKAIAIHRYDKKDHFEEILNCAWVKDRHFCDTLPEYEFDGHITDKVTLKIPSASEENVGKYVCQVIPPDPGVTAPCNFTLTSQSSLKDDEDASLVPILVPVVLVLLLVAVLVVIGIHFRESGPEIPSHDLLLKRQRKLSNRESDEENTQEGNPILIDGSSTESEQGKTEPDRRPWRNKPTESEQGKTEPDRRPWRNQPTESEQGPAPSPPNAPGSNVGGSDKKDEKDTASVDSKDKDGLTPLHWACKRSGCDAVEKLIKYGANVNAKGNDGTTPFHIACENGQDAVLKILLKNGYDVNAKDEQGMTALHWACKHGKAELAKMILDKGADLNAKAHDGSTPLHVASQTGEVGVLETLLLAGSGIEAIEATDKTGMTPLHWACKSGQVSSAKTLLAHGSQTNTRDKDDSTPFHLAHQRGSVEIMHLLREHNAALPAKTSQHKLTLGPCSETPLV